MNAREAVRAVFPPLCALAAGGALWTWLWGRWFSPGGEFLHGCIHLALVAGCLIDLVRARRRAVETGPVPPALATAFLVAAAVLHGRVPTLPVAILYTGAVYWSYRSSPACASGGRSFALWPLLILSLPITPSLQFVFGYPLRALAARAAALILPGAVRSVGCGLGDGTVEVFVDAPCAGAGMLVSALFLAAGASLLFAFEWRRCGVMLVAGTACALSANAVRAAILYLGNAGRFAYPLHEHESATGLFCFAASALILALLALALAGRRRTGSAAAGGGEAAGRPSGPRGKAAHILACAALCVVTIGTPGGRTESTAPLGDVVWPETWNGRAIEPCPETEDARRFWSGFPGLCREFVVLGEGRSAKRVTFRLTTRPTRLLHPAEDCFRGAGYSITPLPARTDGYGRLWSCFAAEKNGRGHIVRQCVVAVPNGDLRDAEFRESARTWPDVSSWYWETATSGSAAPSLSLAVTTLEAP